MAKRLRIAVWYFLPSGGAKRALQYHVRGLSERGHEVVAWRPPVLELEHMSIGAVVPEHEVPLAPILPEGPNYVTRVLGHMRRQRHQMENMQRHAQECARQITEGRFDLLFATNCLLYNAPFVGRYVSGIPKALYLQEPHREFYEAGLKYPWPAPPDTPGASPLKRLKRRIKDHVDLNSARVAVREEQQNAAAFDTILVNSYYSRESLLRAYGLDPTVCYLGIDTSLFQDPGVPRQRFVIGLGTITPAKNVRLAIEALATIEHNRPSLVWVANSVNPPYLSEMKALARERGVDFQPRILIPDAELIDLMGQAGAMIYAPRLEPFGFAPLEANACGLPVVAVAEGGVRETVVDGVNGRLVPSDPKEIGVALQTLLDDPAGAREMGQRAAEAVREKWSVEASIDRLEERLRALVGSA